MSYQFKIEPGASTLASEVKSNFDSIKSNLSTITTDNVEDGAIFGRHASGDRGDWKQVTQHLRSSFTINAAGTTLICPASAPTKTSVEPGQAVLVIATAFVQITHLTTSPELELGIYVDTVKKHSVFLDQTRRVAGGGTNAKFQVSLSYMFQATASGHQIEFKVVAANTNYSITDTGASSAQLNVIGVRS